ncbi:P1 family peptidase [Balneola vulgaris]|uniref:DmpA family aminopeptidase n=1 Tax=Balneola vulgaris TaxID=287535 RepID=UPI0003771C0D|nr:P1 family peptidase [Balneola vulgaris]
MKNLLLLLCIIGIASTATAQQRADVRTFGITPGILTPGPLNSITDVHGVKVGHHTIHVGTQIHTGVTMILPHDGNMYRERVPAAVYVGNGFGKAVGFTQIEELGEIETPIGLTNTLSIHTVANAITDYMLQLSGNQNVRSVNPIVGETNDGYLNDIRGRHVNFDHIYSAIENANTGKVAQGNVGAGAGTRALGFKGGIGSSSRTLPLELGGYTVGVLVQSNFGGVLTIDGVPVGEELKNHYLSNVVPYDVDGSIMIVVATDAPLNARNLKRLARRAFLGIAKVGGFASNGSGDYVIAFSTHEGVRIHLDDRSPVKEISNLDNKAMSPLFLATVEATEEAILNSLFHAEDIEGHNGDQKALPINTILEIMQKYNHIDR